MPKELVRIDNRLQKQINPRVEWIDVAKGNAILLVVLHHSVLLSQQLGVESKLLWDISLSLQVVRMPLFFTAAGIFAGSVIRRPWPKLWSSRLSLLAWTFLLWSVLRFAYFTAVPMDARPQETNILALFASPILPSSGLWFLHSLLVFFVLAKFADGRISVMWQLVSAGVMSVAAFSMPFIPLGWRGIGMYLVFFLAGMHAKTWLISAMERPSALLFFKASAGCALLLWVISTFGLTGFAPLEILLRVFAVLVGFTVSGWLAALPLLSSVLQYMGRNTLPVYVTHIILIAARGTLLTEVFPSFVSTMGFWTPVLIGAISVTVSLGLYQLRHIPVIRSAYNSPNWFSYLPRILKQPVH